MSYLNRAAAYLATDQADKALADCNRTVQLQPDDGKGYVNRTTAYIRLEDREKAIQDARQAIAMLPNHPIAQQNYDTLMKVDDLRAINLLAKAESAFQRGQMELAAKHATDAINRMPSWAGAYATRAGIWLESGEYEKAIRDCDVAIDKDPECYLAFLNRCSAFGAIEQFNRALSDANSAISIAPNQPMGYRFRSIIFRQLGQPQAADQDLYRASQFDQGN